MKEWKVFLIQTHGQSQTFLGDGQKTFLECSHIDDGRFDERGDFVQQGRNFRVLSERSAQPCRLSVEQGLNLCASRIKVRDDMADLLCDWVGTRR